MRRAEMKALIELGLMTNAPFRLRRLSDRTKVRAQRPS
ncbi:MAG: hypothetical protein QOG77_1035 [Solirubrobacteraceae bacterium]|nr:hypothetical protein [Solirubrobacteraceae bacterium]